MSCVQARRDPVDAPAGRGGLVGEAEAGQGGDDQMEGVGGIAAVRGGVGERPDDLQELDDGAGPAVGQQERAGVRLGRADVQKVDADAVDFGPELRMRVDARLRRPPVILVPPIGAELPHVRERNALRPVVDQLRFGKARAGEALAQVLEFGVADFDAVRSDVGHGGPILVWRLVWRLVWEAGCGGGRPAENRRSICPCVDGPDCRGRGPAAPLTAPSRPRTGWPGRRRSCSPSLARKTASSASSRAVASRPAGTWRLRDCTKDSRATSSGGKYSGFST